MNEHENHRFRPPDQQREQAPPSLVPALLARLSLDEPARVSSASLEALRQAMSNPLWTVRASAVRKLANLSDGESFALLLSALHDADASVRAGAICAIGQRGNSADQAVVARLEASLHDPEWHVRETAVYALGTLGSLASLAALRAVLHDSDDGVRRAATQMIDRLQSTAPIENQVPAQSVSGQIPQLPSTFTEIWRQWLHIPRSYPANRREIAMLEEQQDIAGEQPSTGHEATNIPTRRVPARSVKPRRRWITALESGLTALLVLGIILGWLAINSLRHSSSGSPGVFSDANAPSLGAPIARVQGNLSYIEGWSADSRTFFSLQVNTQKHELDEQMLDAATGHAITYPVLDPSWIAPLNQYTIFQVDHYLIALRPHGKNLATMEIWDITGQRAITTQTVSARIGGNGQVLSPYIVPSANAEKLAMFSPDGAVTIWDVASGQKLVTCQGKISNSLPVAIPPTIKWYDHDQDLLLFNRSGPLEAWNAATGARLFSLNNPAKTYSPPMASPDGKYLVRFAGPPAGVALRVDTLEILDAHSGQILHDYHLNVATGTGVGSIWLPDSSHLLTIATYYYNNNSSTDLPEDANVQVRMWDIFTGQTTFNISASHAGTAWTTSNGQYLLIDSPDGRSITIWQLSSNRQIATIVTPGIAIDPYAIFAVSNHYMVVGEKSSFDIWDITTGKLLFKYHGFTPLSIDGNGGSNVFWSPDEKYLTIIAWKNAAIGDGVLALWRMP